MIFLKSGTYQSNRKKEPTVKLPKYFEIYPLLFTYYFVCVYFWFTSKWDLVRKQCDKCQLIKTFMLRTIIFCFI